MGRTGLRTPLFPPEISYRGHVRHLSESVLEEDAMPRLSNYRAEGVEDHVVLCRECQDRLQAEIEFVAAMKAVCGEGQAGGAR